MERRIRPDIRRRMILKPDGTWIVAFKSILADMKRFLTFIADTFLRLVVGYGYRPARSFMASLAIIVFAYCIAYHAWHEGDMVPNSSIVLVEKDWLDYAKDRTGNAAESWANETDVGRDYETFSPIVYALDVFVPIIDFGQENAWAPSTERGWWGRQLYWMRWLFKVFGWIITALGAAAVTGIIRQDR